MKTVVGMVMLALVATPALATRYTDELPTFAGDTWAIASTDDSVALMLVFEEAQPEGSGKFSVYRYEFDTEIIRELSSTEYYGTPTGYKVQDTEGNWHTIDPQGTNAYVVDQGPPVSATNVTGVINAIIKAVCIAGCYADECQGFYPTICCPCCICMHECADITFLDDLCCFYLYGLGGCT